MFLMIVFVILLAAILIEVGIIEARMRTMVELNKKLVEKIESYQGKL